MGFFILLLSPVLVACSCFLYLPVFLWNKKRLGKRPFVRHVALICLLCELFTVLFATILFYGSQITFHPSYHLLNLIPFVWIWQPYEMGVFKMITELVLNIAMTVPLGFFLPVVFPRLRKLWKTILWVAGGILCIEVFQYFIGRSADVDDLLMNTLGGVIGYGIFRFLDRKLQGKALWQKALDNGTETEK